MSNITRDSRRWADGLLAGVVWLAAMLIAIAFCWIVGDLLWHGLSHVSWQFLVSAPENAGREGGIGPILVSTLLILGVCLIVALPVGLGTAFFLSELSLAYQGLGRWIRLSLEVLAGVPSIVFGLFGNAFFCKVLGLGFSILAGGLTLACMVLPILIRTTEEGLRSVPREYRLGGAALGFSQTTLLRHVLLPSALPGLTVGLILGVGRSLAETAALIFTSGYVDRMPSSLLDSGRSLSIHIFDLSMNVSGGNDNAYASAIVLLLLLLFINALASGLSEYWLKETLPTR